MSYIACILAAGKGTRMKSNKAKVLHEIAGLPMISHIIHTLKSSQCEDIIVITSPEQIDVRNEISPHFSAIQEQQLGTADAVKSIFTGHRNFEDDHELLVVCGDTPLITRKSLDTIYRHRQTSKALFTFFSFSPEDPLQYGRMITDEVGHLTDIVEFSECSASQKNITLCNSGIMMGKVKDFKTLLPRISNDNHKGEYFITDIPKLVSQMDNYCDHIDIHPEEIIGINTQKQLSQVEWIMQGRLRDKFLDNGVIMQDPNHVYFSYDTIVEAGAKIDPFVTIGVKTKIGKDTHIKSFCHLEAVSIQKNCIIGPYARLRPGTELEDNVKIGNFVETKKSHLSEGSKVNHLTYIGDAKVGKHSNIGAGTITCNYDGYNKHETIIGDNVFVGSNAALIAPVCIGNDSMIAAGSVITKSVEENSLAITRPPQKNLVGGAKKIKNKLKNK